MGAKNLEDMLNQQLHLSLEGIGASLQSEDGYAVVKEVVPGMAADKDGRLQPEDKIVGIQKEDGEEIDLVEKKLSDVVRYIRGPAGTKVRLIVQPAGTKERKIYELTRAEDRAQGAARQGPSHRDQGRTASRSSSASSTCRPSTATPWPSSRATPTPSAPRPTAASSSTTSRPQGVDAVVIDLRDNGGGLLEEAKTLSGLFIDTGPVVQVKEVFGVKHLDDDDEGTAWDGPLVVLIDQLSASASEIFAGVIKDYGRGLIIGDSSTFGKGTVQSIVPIGEPCPPPRPPRTAAPSS